MGRLTNIAQRIKDSKSVFTPKTRDLKEVLEFMVVNNDFYSEFMGRDSCFFVSIEMTLNINPKTGEVEKSFSYKPHSTYHAAHVLSCNGLVYMMYPVNFINDDWEIFSNSGGEWYSINMLENDTRI